MRLLLSSLLFFLATIVSAQKCLWLASTDCGALMNARQLCVDAKGNVYAGGEYEGEACFHSADTKDTSITKYCSDSWHKTFIARYNPLGKITMVVQFKTTGSNSSLTYGQGMQILPDGNLVVFVEGGGDFVNPKGEHTKPASNGRGYNLYCIDSLGRLKWSQLVPVEQCYDLRVSPNGTIYVYGKSNSYTNDKILQKYSAHGISLSSLTLKGPGINTMAFKGSKLYVLVSNGGYGNYIDKNEKVRSFDMPKDNVGLFELDTASFAAKNVFMTALPIQQGYSGTGVCNFRSCINCTSSEVYVDFLLAVDYSTTFASKQFTRMPNNMHLVRLDQRGNMYAGLDFKSGYDNVCFIPAPDGGMYFTVGVWGRSFVLGNDSIVFQDLPDFLEEQVVMRLDAHYKKMWWKIAGATASNYHSTKLVATSPGEVYIFSDMLLPEFIFQHQVSMPWKFLTYVAKLKE